ncbi:uncharacterized protein LOC114517561 [Dendronephthya gigantea]|uniref:uncharacterized protein LOC114517245 n=1 Tax=Dendronephthya gigantea TaxID=151771 RepID=UPI00106BF022|nr:uncharacterized protein LOC114517245 [Dendronephthya gigantea]XP_028393142.1 uncharacterized protein LOC114517561 [Dendronephthya gigantea]
MDIDDEYESEFPVSLCSDFEQTMALLEMDIEEVQSEVEHSLEEVEGKKQFPCNFCEKVCKSKGGLTKHQRSKHVEQVGESSSSSKIEKNVLSVENVCSIIRDIGRHLVDEKLYKEEQTAEIFKLSPTDLFVSFVNQLLLKFKRKRNQDKFLTEFYGNSYANWKKFFHPYGEQKIVFLMLIHLPQRLIGFLEKGQDDQGISKEEMSLLPHEYGPLSYLTGYVIRSFYQKSKNCSRSNSARNKEIQALMSSMRQETERNEYISSLSRGGLWAPHEWIVRIAEVAELAFRKSTNKDKVTFLPVDIIVNEVLTSPLVKSLWNNIIQNCSVQISKECQCLCLENVVKLYVTVRSFSLAKDIVNKYKLSQRTQKTKALRKDLKKASEVCL